MIPPFLYPCEKNNETQGNRSNEKVSVYICYRDDSSVCRTRVCRGKQAG